MQAVSVGGAAGQTSQGSGGIAIGYGAAANVQGTSSIAIGKEAARYNQGQYAIAIGAVAGYPNAQANNSIVINATGANLDAPGANRLYIKPVRTVNSTAGLNQLYYNSTTGEIVVYVP